MAMAMIIKTLPEDTSRHDSLLAVCVFICILWFTSLDVWPSVYEVVDVVVIELMWCFVCIVTTTMFIVCCREGDRMIIQEIRPVTSDDFDLLRKHTRDTKGEKATYVFVQVEHARLSEWKHRANDPIHVFEQLRIQHRKDAARKEKKHHLRFMKKDERLVWLEREHLEKEFPTTTAT